MRAGWIMPDSGAAFGVIALTLAAAACAISVLTRDSARTAEGFFLAGRGVGSVVGGLAASGEFFTAALLVSLIATAHSLGFDAAWLAAGAAGGLAGALLHAAAFRRSGCHTVADFTYARFGSDRIRLVSVIALLLTSMCYLVPLVYSAGALWSLLGGASVPGLRAYSTGVVVAGLASVLCAVSGGMKGTTLGQALQSVALGMVALAILASALLTGQLAPSDGREAVWGDTGNPSIVVRDRATGDVNAPEQKTPIDEHGVPSRLSMLLSLAFGMAGLPHILARYGANRSGVAARRSAVWAFVFACTLAGAASIAGFLDAASVEGPAASASGFAPAFAVLAGDQWWFGALVAALFAVVLAAIAGLLVAAASAVGHDIYGAYVNPHASDARKVLVGRAAMIGVSVISLGAGLAIPEVAVAVGYPAVITSLVAWALSTASAAFLPVLLTGIWWRRTTERGALSGMIVGTGGSTLLVLMSTLSQSGYVRAEGVFALIGDLALPAIITLPAALLSIIVVSEIDGQLPKNLDEVWQRIHRPSARTGERSLPLRVSGLGESATPQWQSRRRSRDPRQADRV